MGQNRVLGGTFSPQITGADDLAIETNYQTDAYIIPTAASGIFAAVVSLDPLAVNGDRVIIKDGAGHAAVNNITVQTNIGYQSLVGHPSGIVLNEPYASVSLYFVHDATSSNIHAGFWYVDVLSNSSSAPQ